MKMIALKSEIYLIIIPKLYFLVDVIVVAGPGKLPWRLFDVTERT